MILPLFCKNNMFQILLYSSHMTFSAKRCVYNGKNLPSFNTRSKGIRVVHLTDVRKSLPLQKVRSAVIKLLVYVYLFTLGGALGARPRLAELYCFCRWFALILGRRQKARIQDGTNLTLGENPRFSLNLEQCRPGFLNLSILAPLTPNSLGFGFFFEDS